MLEDYLKAKKESMDFSDEPQSEPEETAEKPPTVQEVENFKTESDGPMLNMSEDMDIKQKSLPPTSTKNQVQVNPLMLHKLPDRVIKDKEQAIERSQ